MNNRTPVSSVPKTSPMHSPTSWFDVEEGYSSKAAALPAAGVVRRLWQRHKPRREDGESSFGFLIRCSLMYSIIIIGKCPSCRNLSILCFLGLALCLAAYLSGGWAALGNHILMQLGLQGKWHFPSK